MKQEYYSNSQEYLNRWVVSYADFVTILLALFMVLYALGQANIVNLKNFQQSVESFFKPPQKIEKIDIISQKKDLLKIFATTTTKITNNKEEKSSTSLDLIKGRLASAALYAPQEDEFLTQTETYLKKSFQNNENIIILKEPKGLIIRLNDAGAFKGNSGIIKNDAYFTLDKLASTIKKFDNSIQIKVVSAKTFSKDDWNLSNEKAKNITYYFSGKKKINSDRFLISYEEGKEKPYIDIIVLNKITNINF